MLSSGERGWKHSCQLDSENQIHYLIKSLWLQTQPAHSEDLGVFNRTAGWRRGSWAEKVRIFMYFFLVIWKEFVGKKEISVSW